MGKVKCPSCQSENRKTKRNCIECGQRLHVPRGLDDGICFSYWKLSYRRKFYRNLLILNIYPLILLIPNHWMPFNLNHNVVFPILLVWGVTELVYTYTRWKDLEA